MDKGTWGKMLSDAKKRVQPTDTATSGGAAWADHLAVKLYLDGDIASLKLRLPAPIDPATGRFKGGYGTSGGTANYYHDIFSKKIGVDTLGEIQKAIQKGAKVTYEPEGKGYGAMFARNAKVAAEADSVLAYTHGKGDVPADGGTLNTWNKNKSTDKTHVSIGEIGKTPAESVVPKVAPKTVRPAKPATPKTESIVESKAEPQGESIGKNLGKLPMYYKMPPEGVRADLRSSYPEGVTTAQLMKDGLRKATTRNKFGEIGDTFEVGGDKYIITEIRKVDLTTPEGKRAWANLEGWDADFAMKKYPNQVKTGATQTVFKKVEPPAEPAPVTSKNKFYAYVNPTEGKQGVIQGWDNIKSKIQGVSGARVQGFSTEKEAQTWLKKGGIYEPKGEGTKTKKEKFFAWKLPNGEEGVTSGWEETAKKVKGLSGAKFKGFETEGEASRWLRAGADYKVKHIAEKPGIYFDAGTGGTGEVRIGVSNERGDSFLTASAKMPEGATNNYGELLALKSALEHAKKTGGKEIFGDSKLVINFWSKGYVSNVIREKSPATYKLAQEVAKLRAEYEKTGGKIDYISGGSNPADLGYHKI